MAASHPGMGVGRARLSHLPCLTVTPQCPGRPLSGWPPCPDHASGLDACLCARSRLRGGGGCGLGADAARNEAARRAQRSTAKRGHQPGTGAGNAGGTRSRRGAGTGESLARAPGGSAPHADGTGEGAGVAEDTLRDGVGTALRRLCRGLSPECQATSQAACWAARAPSSGGSLGANISDSLTLSPPNPTCPSSHSSSAPSPTELCLRVQRLRHPRAHGAVTAASVRAPFLPTLPAELQALPEDDAAALPAPEPSCCLTRVRRGPALVGLNAPRGRGGSE